jgi:hypothetical protein
LAGVLVHSAVGFLGVGNQPVGELRISVAKNPRIVLRALVPESDQDFRESAWFLRPLNQPKRQPSLVRIEIHRGESSRPLHLSYNTQYLLHAVVREVEHQGEVASARQRIHGWHLHHLL